MSACADPDRHPWPCMCTSPERPTSPPLAVALDALIHRADVAGWPEVEPIVDLLGWPRAADEMPDGAWIRSRLAERIRP